MTRKLVSTFKVDGPTFVGLTATALPYVKAKPGEIEPFRKMCWNFLSDVSDSEKIEALIREFPTHLAMWHSITDQKISILDISLVDGRFIVQSLIPMPPVLIPTGVDLGGDPFLARWVEHMEVWKTTSIVMRGVEWDYYMKSVLDVAQLRYKSFTATSWEQFVYDTMTVQLALAQQKLLTLLPQYFSDQEMTFELLVDLLDLVMSEANEALDWHMRYLMLYDLSRVKRWIMTYEKKRLAKDSVLTVVAEEPVVAPPAVKEAVPDALPPQSDLAESASAPVKPARRKTAKSKKAD